MPWSMRGSGKEQAHPTKHFRAGQVPRAVVVPSVSINQVLPHLKPPLMLLGVTAAPDWRGEEREKTFKVLLHAIQGVLKTHSVHTFFCFCEVLKKVSSLSKSNPHHPSFKRILQEL